jgi:CRP-like cAMP-binding protein
MFNFKQETTDKGTYIFKEGETSNGLFLVKSGIIEILVRVEGYQLAIERLYRGSIINHNAFLIGDICDISARCIDTQTLFYLSYETIDKIRMKHPQLSNSVDALRKKTALNKNPFIIDYIMGKRVVRSSRPQALEEKRGLLTAKLKNLIMILLAKVKAQKNQTSFKEVLSGIITRKKEEI